MPLRGFGPPQKSKIFLLGPKGRLRLLGTPAQALGIVVLAVPCAFRCRALPTTIAQARVDVTKPYEFIGFGAMDVTKPCELVGFGAMDVTKPYEFIGFGAGRSRAGFSLRALARIIIL